MEITEFTLGEIQVKIQLSPDFYNSVLWLLDDIRVLDP